MDILIVAATQDEIAPTIQYLDRSLRKIQPALYQKNQYRVVLLVTGVGMVATAWQMGLFLANQTPDWTINAGIAGAFDPALQLGDVVEVISDCTGDLGAETADQQFLDLFDLQLSNPEATPFTHGRLVNPQAEYALFLPKAHGLTVNRVHGSADSIRATRMKYPHVQVETMESAAFFYACLQSRLLFTAIRSVSNYVEPRNRDNWKIDVAVKQLNLVVIEMLENLFTTL